jgi:hypothetical protein
MNKIQRLKDNIDAWFSEHPRYVIYNEKVIQHPLNKKLMTFNINFSDIQRKIRYNDIRYNITAFENEMGDCIMQLDGTFLTGVSENINEEKVVDEYKVSIKNIGDSGEAVVRVDKKINEDEEISFDKTISILMEKGIDRLIF